MATLILSDVHLGHPASKVKDAEQLLPLFHNIDHVIFNGDTYEQRFRHEQAKFHKFYNNLNEVLDLLPHTYLCGNHDPYISQDHSIAFPEGVLVTHGDIICPKTISSSTCALKHRESQIEKSVNRKGDATRLRYFLTNTLPPTKVLSTLKLWKTFHHQTRNLVSHDLDNKFVITGHYHKAGINLVKNHTSINTGSFMHLSKALAVVIDADTLKVYEIIKRHSAFSLGKQVASFKL